MAIIQGTPGDDLLEGTDDKDWIYGYAGRDRLYGFGDDDSLFGAAGRDSLFGGTGTNRLYGEGDDDVLRDSGAGSQLDGGQGFDRAIVDRSAVTDNLRAAFRPIDGVASPWSDGSVVRDVETLDLTSGSGDDRLTLSALRPGTCSWNGGAGSDTVSIDLSGAATALWTDGRTVTGDGVTVNLSNVERVVLYGGDGVDSLGVTTATAAFYGNGGDDDLHGGFGSDLLDGGAGNDRLFGGEGAARLFGGDGDDSLSGGGTRSTFDGGRGLDWLSLGRAGLSADVTVSAGSSRSNLLPDGTSFTGIERLWLTTGGGNDRLVGGVHDDQLFSGSGDDVVNGRAGSDWLIGDGGANRLSGGDGDDWIDDAGARSHLDGGSGHDVLRITRTALTEDVTIDLAAAVNLLPDRTRFTNFEVLEAKTGSGNDRLTGGDSGDSFTGNGGDDTLIGGGGRDFLYGGTGSNRLYGGDGADWLEDDGEASTFDGGDNGGDFARMNRTWMTQDVDFEFRLSGGQVLTMTDGSTIVGVETLDLATGWGNDTVSYVYDGPDSGALRWNGNGGEDHGIIDVSRYDGPVTARAGFVSAAGFRNIETLVLRTGSSDDDLLGITGDDTIDAGAGNDIVDGSAGDDVLTGGAGDDRLTGGPGRNRFVFGAGSGQDLVADFTDGLDRLDVSAFGYRSLDALVAAGGSIAASGSGTLVTLSSAGETVLLELVPPALVTGADFVFA